MEKRGVRGEVLGRYMGGYLRNFCLVKKIYMLTKRTFKLFSHRFPLFPRLLLLQGLVNLDWFRLAALVSARND